MIASTHPVPGSAGTAELSFTDGRGGHSSPPYSAAKDDQGGLNLALHVGDDPAAVHLNRQALAAAVGVPVDRLVAADQVHGRDVVLVDGPWAGSPAQADAMVTTTPGVALMVLVADCVPVLLAAPDDGVVAVAHAGRPGLVAGVVPATVAAMRDLGAGRLVAVLGPSVCARCYEVPRAMREDVAAQLPVSRSVTWTGTPSLDVAAGVLAQLDGLGVAARQVPGCTVQDASLYSYRRQGLTGRFAGVVRWQPAAVSA